jgi:anti-anti-sigma factor
VSGPDPDQKSDGDEQFPAPSPALLIEEIARGESRTLHLSGELDLMSAELLETAIRRLVSERDDGLIVLDLSDVSFMDSTGLRAVLVGIAVCVEHKRELELLPGPDQVQRLFEVSGLLEELPFISVDDSASGD